MSAMSKEDQRPTDPMTAADALILREEIKNLMKDEMRLISNRLSNMQRSLIEVFGVLETLSASLTETRTRRLEEEIFEVDQEREILEKRLNIVQAKKEMKKSDTPAIIDTNERIKKAAESTYAERERLEEEAREVVWTKRKDAVITAIMVTTSVGIVGSIIAALVWFVQFYLSNR
jgi:preprotein translocase subunit SecE